MPRQAITPQPYPYSIRDFTYALPGFRNPPPASTNKLNLWAVQEFVRIEVSLRSSSVMDLYRAEGRTLISALKLLVKFGFPWTVLDGSHHQYLNPDRAHVGPIPGFMVAPLGEFLEAVAVLAPFAPSETWHQEFRQSLQDNFLALHIDPAIPPDDLLNTLRPLLVERHLKAKRPVKQPREFDPSTWADYLACYDSHVRDGRGYGDIGDSVYAFDKGEDKRDRAKKAVKRVRLAIAAAERGDWPPTEF